MYNAGNYDEAVVEANNAKKWAKWALIAGIAQYVIAIIYYVFVLGALVLNAAE